MLPLIVAATLHQLVASTFHVRASEPRPVLATQRWYRAPAMDRCWFGSTPSVAATRQLVTSALQPLATSARRLARLLATSRSRTLVTSAC